MGEPTATSYLAAHLADTLEVHGFDAAPALRASGIASSDLVDPDLRLPVATVFRFWREVEELTGEPLFGLKTAANVAAGYPVFRHMLANSPTLGAAYERWCSQFRLITDAGTIRLASHEQTPMLVYERAVSDPMPALGENWTVGQWLTLGRRLTDRNWTPRAVWLTHDGRGEADAYARWFGVPVTFNADHAAMAFDPATLEAAIPAADGTLLNVLDRHVSGMVADLPPASNIIASLRALIAQRFADGQADPGGIASQMAMSDRTLQRRLKEEGTSLSQVFNEVRRGMAETTLGDSGISIGEIAYLLGFSEPSAFHRAFKRWTGLTPAAYREQRLPTRFDADGQ